MFTVEKKNMTRLRKVVFTIEKECMGRLRKVGKKILNIGNMNDLKNSCLDDLVNIIEKELQKEPHFDPSGAPKNNTETNLTDTTSSFNPAPQFTLFLAYNTHAERRGLPELPGWAVALPLPTLVVVIGALSMGMVDDARFAVGLGFVARFATEVLSVEFNSGLDTETLTLPLVMFIGSIMAMLYMMNGQEEDDGGGYGGREIFGGQYDFIKDSVFEHTLGLKKIKF